MWDKALYEYKKVLNEKFCIDIVMADFKTLSTTFYLYYKLV